MSFGPATYPSKQKPIRIPLGYRLRAMVDISCALGISLRNEYYVAVRDRMSHTLETAGRLVSARLRWTSL